MKDFLNKKLDFLTNNKKIFSILLVFGVAVLLGLELFNRGSYSNETDGDSITISCPDVVVAGSEVECVVNLNSASINAEGLSAKYSFAYGGKSLGFNGFIANDGWTIETSEDVVSGFVIVNLDGVTGSSNVGKINVLVPEDAVANDVYKVGLVDAKMGDGETKIEFDDVFAELRVVSNVNTLDGISLNGNLIEGFNKNKYDYNIELDSDSVIISVEKTDAASSVTGDGEHNLHYGTNIIELIVIGEDDKSQTYKLNLYRPYEFDTEHYIYNEDNNYLYTGVDTSTDVILSNLNIDSSLNKKIVNGKLVIEYNGEKLLEINVLNIDFNKYSIFSNEITISANVKMNEFSDNVRISDGLSYVIYKDEDVEVTDDDILLSDMILKVYYGQLELDSYIFNVINGELEYDLTFANSLSVDEEKKFINQIVNDTLVENIMSLVNVTGANLKIVDVDGITKGDTSMLSTGDKLVIYNGDEIIDEYLISVRGDTNGDGKVNLVDLVQLRKQIVEWEDEETGEIFNKTGVYYNAIDLDENGEIGLIDLVKLRKIIVGIE